MLVTELRCAAQFLLVRQLVADGELPVRVIGTRQWIIREEAVAWLRKQVA